MSYSILSRRISDEVGTYHDVSFTGKGTQCLVAVTTPIQIENESIGKWHSLAPLR
jgi:hypothetical protein